VSYRLEFSSRRKTLGIQVKHGEVVVRAPSGVSPHRIEAFVQSRQDWIEHHRSRQLQHLSEQEVRICQQGRVPLQGGWRTLSWSRSTCSGVRLSGSGNLHVTLSPRIRREEAIAVRQQLYRWYRQQAEQILLSRLQACARTTGLQPSSGYIGQWRGRWGQCSVTGEIGLNWRLLQLPEALQDYVILHELCHLHYMDHGREFHRLLTSICPEQRQLSRDMAHFSPWLNW